tara:strand:+ start:83 stop:298 length:216 start_codon:yes stop_codon:yes gene_type:complete
MVMGSFFPLILTMEAAISTQITTAFSQQFSANIQMLSQQKGSLLRNAVSEESVVGEKAFFDQVNYPLISIT